MPAPMFAFLDLSTPDLLIILAVVLVLFGAKRLPELSKSIGQAARELRKGLTDDEHANEKKTDSKEPSES